MSIRSAYKKEEIMRNKAGTPEIPAAFFKNIYIGSLRHKHTDKRPACSICQAKADIVENKIYFCASCKCKMEGINGT